MNWHDIQLGLHLFPMFAGLPMQNLDTTPLLAVCEAISKRFAKIHKCRNSDEIGELRDELKACKEQLEALKTEFKLVVTQTEAIKSAIVAVSMQSRVPVLGPN